MTQVQFTLTEQEILQVLSGDREESFKMPVKKILDQIMLVESAKQLGADRHGKPLSAYRDIVIIRQAATMLKLSYFHALSGST